MENADPEDFHRFLGDEQGQLFNDTVELIKSKGSYTEENIKERLGGPWNFVTTDDPCNETFEERLTGIYSIDLTMDALSRVYAGAVKSLPREQAWVFIDPESTGYFEIALNEVVDYIEQALSEQGQ